MIRACTILATVMLPLLATPVAFAQRSGVEIWVQNCGGCHTIQTGNRFHAAQWPIVMDHMKITARLTDDEANAVLEFLKSGALPLTGAPASHDPSGPPTAVATHPGMAMSPEANASEAGMPAVADLFMANCSTCHGTSGEGNGPAAIFLIPKPADFTDATFHAARSDEHLGHSIREGTGSMPSFKASLTGDEVTELVRYVRSLAKE